MAEEQPPPVTLPPATDSPEPADDRSATPSEEDLRTKFVYPFLRSRGFSEGDLDFEFSFSVRSGHGKIQTSRADVLVKNKQGRPLYVIECKRENHSLTAADRQQAVSYARLVQPQMPPYAVLTNGTQTILLDTLTTQPVASETRTEDGLAFSQVGLDEMMRLRHQALKTLLSLSSASLKVFLKYLINRHINAHSNGKLRPPYNIATHIVRTVVQQRLSEFCEHSDARVLPLVGSATAGKSSECFTFVQSMLDAEQSKILPIYISVAHSGPVFLSQISDDFGWAFRQTTNPSQIIHDIDEIAFEQRIPCVAYILDGADLGLLELSQLRREIVSLLDRTGDLSCKHKAVIVAQKSTWSRLIMGASIDLSSYGVDKEVDVGSLTPQQKIAHVHALQSFYEIQLPLTAALFSFSPVIVHMLAERSKELPNALPNVGDVLGKYFTWQLSKSNSPDVVREVLTSLASLRLEGTERVNTSGARDILDDAVRSGFLIRATDGHSRESFAFADEWMLYYIIGLHIWKLDVASPESIREIAAKKERSVESARALEWMASVVGDGENWKLAAQIRPEKYFSILRSLTDQVPALSVSKHSHIWLAPYNGRHCTPWLSVVDGALDLVEWGSDPELPGGRAPLHHVMNPDLSMFGRTDIVECAVEQAGETLRELEKWLKDRREYSGNRLWPCQYVVFEKLRRQLKGRNYNLAEIARSLEAPGSYLGGVDMLREILESAMKMVHRIAESEFAGIHDDMHLPSAVRLEVEVGPDTSERSEEYWIDSSELTAQVVLAPYGQLERWWAKSDEFRDAQKVRLYGGFALYNLLDVPWFYIPHPRFSWTEHKQNNGIRKVNAVGNLAARWLAHGVSSVLSGRDGNFPRGRRSLGRLVGLAKTAVDLSD